MIQPIFDDLANDNSANDDLVFTMIDLGVGLGTQVADEWSVRAVPTFLFFFDGRLVCLGRCALLQVLIFEQRFMN